MGNIDKRAMREGCTRAKIENEVMSRVPELPGAGGFSPMVDHAVPPGVPFDNVKYYLDLVQEACRATQ